MDGRTDTASVGAESGFSLPLRREDLSQALPQLVRVALQQSAVAIVLLSPDGSILFANDATAALAGRTAAEMIGTLATDLAHPDDRAAAASAAGPLVRGESDSYRRTGRYQRPGGEVVHVDISTSAVRDDSGGLIALLALVVDVTELEASRQEADVARELLRGAIDSLLDPWVYLLAVRDLENRIVDFTYTDANAAACAANGLSREALLGARLLDLLPGHAVNGLMGRYAQVVETGAPLALDDFPYTSELIDADVRWYDNRAVRIGDGVSFTWRDVTDRVLHRQLLSVQASTDSLTGLANRQQLMDTMAVVFERVPRVGQSIAILYCDLDGLKWINDTHGHEFGDVVLRAVADRMAGAVRGEDLVARIGGDEFVVVADGITDHPAAVALATKVAAAVTRPVTHGDATVLPTLSIGVSLSAPGEDATRALRKADEELYRHKSGNQMRLDLT